MSRSILLADDSAVARRAIRNLVTERLGDTITYDEAAGGLEALGKAIASKPDVAVLDIAMLPGLTGVEAARCISQQCPQTAVLTISNHDVEPILPLVKQAGVRGFVPKASMASQLVPAIEALLEGKTYFASQS